MNDDLEIKLQEVFEWVGNHHGMVAEQIKLEMGIWSADDTPYSFYVLLTKPGKREFRDKTEPPATILGGESSYGSETLTKAIDALLNDLYNGADDAT